MNNLAIHGQRVIESRFVPRDQILTILGTIAMHPLTYMQVRYPHSPIWTTRTLGHAEMRRDQRKHRRA